MKVAGNNLNIDLVEEDERPDTTNVVVDEDRPIASLGGKPDPDVVNEDSNPLDELPEDAVVNQDGSITLPLYYPQSVASRKNGEITNREFKELTFQRLNGAALRSISNAKEGDQTVVTFAESTRINQAVMNALFNKLDGADITRCGRVINHFLSSGPKTRR